MRQTIMLMAACAALLASCTNEEMNEGLGIDTPIQVTANVEGIMTTRAENTEYNLDNFGLFIKDKDGNYTEPYGGENISVTKPEDESVWTLADEVLYQGSGQTYFAYAPYQSIGAGVTSVDFSIKTDQSGSEYMQASDLLYAAGSVTSPELTVNFSHKLCKLTVKLQTEADFSGNISYEHLYLRGCLPTTSLNLTDGTLSEAKGEEAIDTEMWHNKESGTYECILVPQTVKYSVVIDAKVNNSPKSYVYTPANAYEFKSNNSYTLTLTVRKADEPTAIEGIDVKGWDESIALGDGEAVEPYTVDAEGHYTVYTAEGLQAWADAVGESSLHNPVNCTLDADIDMTGQNWTPIMTGLAPQYTGVFDGNGHTITGLGNCLLEENEGEVRNLTLVNPTGLTLPGSSFSAGAVAGRNEGTIENCHVVGGSVKGDAFSGGIVGINGGTIRACSSSAMVTTDGYNDSRGGGIVGVNAGPVLACYATGSVNAGDGMEGAIAGENANNYGGIMTACFWSGESAQGVGYGSEEGVEEVAGDVSWADAAEAMNEALKTDGSSYRWKVYEGDETGNRPLVIVTR